VQQGHVGGLQLGCIGWEGVDDARIFDQLGLNSTLNLVNLEGTMARKTSTYTVDFEGRDKGKTFLITEMSVTKAEDWAIRAMLALGAANVEIPDGALQLGMAALAEVGLKKLFAIDAASMRPLLAELMECIEFIPNPQKPQVKLAYPMFESQVEEVKTLFILKWEVLKLHLDFSRAAGLSESLGNTLEAAKHKPSTRMSQR
jgi:hypothetical protein